MGVLEGKNEALFDAEAVKKYGADKHGMKKYIFAFLYKGSNRDLSQEESNKLQMQHLQNIDRLADEGKLAIAGPFFGDGDLRGLYIFNVQTIEEAEALVNSDPAIQQKSLRMELKEWYGSAALMAVNDVHKTLAEKGMMEE